MIASRALRSCGLEARFELLKLVRLPMYALPTLAFPAMFYLFFGVAMGHQQVSPDLSLAKYLLATYGAFGVVAASLFGFGVSVAMERGQGWLMLKRASPMPIASYFAAKLAAALTFSFTIVLILLALGLGFGGVHIAFGSACALVAVLVVGALPFCALGLAIGTLAGPNSAPAIVNMINLPLAFLGGLWIPLEGLPPSFAHLAVWLPTYHFGQLALATIGGGSGSPLVHVAVLAVYTALFLALAAYGWRRDEGKLYG
ncbi:MAG: ABC transporter permease [Candidatus Eremiobacteraeota bacterium]|nr:ABC transporter permease [Candidatus Eremiobacteraeota bacterium]